MRCRSKCILTRFQGRTLEEIDEIFADPHPVKASLRKQRVVVEADEAMEKSEL